MDRPTIEVPHQFKLGGDIHIYRARAMTFIKLMDRLYPDLISGSEHLLGDGGLLAFHADGRFIGSMIERKVGAKIQVGSYRKNPWLEESPGEELMLRAHLAACHIVGNFEFKARVRRYWNYGSLKFLYKLGLGGRSAFKDASIVSAAATVETRAAMLEYMEESKGNYANVRDYALTRRKSIPMPAVAAALPRADRIDVVPFCATIVLTK